MKKLTLSSILLFCLVIPVIMIYRIGPGETPYWLFGIIFGLLLTNLFVSEKLKSVLTRLLIILVIGSAYCSAIVVRHKTAPVYQVHDIILQQEAAIRFLLQGQNPYAVTYFNTPLEQWYYSNSEVNPALYHLVMMPGYILFSLPFYFFSLSVFGFFDGRIPLVMAFILLLILAWKLVKDSEPRRQFLILLAFNPATLGYFLEGRSDFLLFAFLFWSWYLLEKKHLFLAGVPLAIALAIKQSAWPIFPFYLAFLWFNNRNQPKEFLKNLLSLAIVFSLIVLPFFLWDKVAFIRSTILYLNGNTQHSYPISGYGWGMVLAQMGKIKDLHQYYPFWIWQVVIGLPLGLFLFRWLQKSPIVSRLIVSYGVFTLFFWYFSRYFNNSHLGYLSTVFISGYFWPKNK